MTVTNFRDRFQLYTETQVLTSIIQKVADIAPSPPTQVFSSITVYADSTAGGSEFSNPMTAVGDIIYASDTASPATPARLGIGTEHFILTVISGIPGYRLVQDRSIDFGIGANQVNNDDLPLLNIIGSPTVTTTKDELNMFGSAGTFTGFEMTDGGSETIDVAAGTAAIRSSDDHTEELFMFDFAGSSGHAMPTDANRFIGIEYNAGTPQVVVKSADTWNMHDEFPIGCVSNEAGTLHIKNNPAQIANFGGHSSIRWYESEPLARADRFGGLIIGETGTRNVTITAGALFDRLNKFPISAFNTSGADRFDSYLDNVLASAADAQWDNDNYNNGGVLTTLGNNRYAVLWFYLESDGGVVCLYGADQYVSLAGATAESPPTTIPLRIECHGRLIGRILFQKGDSIAQDIESVFDVSFSPTGVTDHNDLANLQGGVAGEYFHLTSAEHSDLGDEKVKVSSNDTTPDFLFNKLREGPGIDLTEFNDGGDEEIIIGVDTTKIGTTTWGSGSGITWTFDASGGTDVTFVFDNNSLAINGEVGIGTTPKTQFTIEGALTIKEQGSADADNAGYGQIIVRTATPNELVFVDDAGGEFQLGNGGFIRAVRTETSSYLATVNDCVIFLGNALGATLTLPAAGTNTGRHFWLVNITGGATWTLTTVVDNATLAPGRSVHVVSDGSDWRVVGT